MIGRLTNDRKFTLRNASSNGCPEGLASSVIVGNDTNIRISHLKIYCCHKDLCNRAIRQHSIQLHILLGYTIFIVFFSSIFNDENQQ